jgi:anti-anti-sigma factor
MTFLLIPLDEAIVFPGVTATLPIDTGDDDRVFLLPRQDGDFGRIGVVAEVIERGQLPNGAWVATVVGLHRGLAGAAQPAEESFTRILAGGTPHLAIDLADLQYISSAGLRVLLVVAKKVQQAKGKVVLFGLGPNVREVFSISGFDKIFSIQSDSASAVAALR